MIVPLPGNNGKVLYDKIMNIDHENPREIWERLR